MALHSGQGRFGTLDDCSKRGLVAHGQVGQNLAVEFHTRLPETIHEHAVRHTQLLGTGIDAGDPQPAEITLAGAPVAIRILAGLEYGLTCHPVTATTGAVVTFRFLENL